MMKSIFISIFLCFSLISCTNQPTPESNAKHINHIVLVWFKAGTSQAEVDSVIRETKKLEQYIPQIQSLSLGKAISSERKIVDDSFDLGISLTFKNQADMKVYLSHPKHIAFVKTYVKPKLAKLLVYDF